MLSNLEIIGWKNSMDSQSWRRPLWLWAYLRYKFHQCDPTFPCEIAHTRNHNKTDICCHETTFTATRNHEAWLTNCHQPTRIFWHVVTGTLADLLVCFAYRIFWHLIGSDPLSYFLKLDCLPIFKGKSYTCILSYLNLSLIRQFVKDKG